jgi:hypothetical protein
LPHIYRILLIYRNYCFFFQPLSYYPQSFVLLVPIKLASKLKSLSKAALDHLLLRLNLLRSFRVFKSSSGYLPYLRTAALKAPIGMISLYERAFLCWYAAERYTGSGLIVELGSFAGASTVAISEGLTRSKHSAINGNQKPLRVYDRFICGEYEAYFLNLVTHSQAYSPGQAFFPLFTHQTSKHKDQFEIFNGDLNLMFHDGSPIEFLFVDSMKDFELAAHIARQFFPALLSGSSLLLHQDYVHYYTSWIHILMFNLRECFEFMYHIPKSGSAVFRVLDTPSRTLSVHDLMSCDDSLIKQAFAYSRQMIPGPMRENVDAAEVMHYVHLKRPDVALGLFRKWKSHYGRPKFEMAEVERILAKS